MNVFFLISIHYQFGIFSDQFARKYDLTYGRFDVVVGLIDALRRKLNAVSTYLSAALAVPPTQPDLYVHSKIGCQ